ncbi:transcription antitermination factor NusB [Reinekea sp.]|jgi:N utilization substance protein B|uniref:transcription antitermination factor NusB n=1 Tax=Reinekea sp. TaxID=1970455 RepID=UPI002A7F2F93|nr:transcription antitermination factor NusB [Reinekea sp.]
MTVNKVNPGQRRKARRLAIQALYQWQVAETPVTQIEAEFLADNDMTKVDKDYFCELLRGVPKFKSEFDDLIGQYTDRTSGQMTPIELAILRIGTYELIHRIDVPYKVVINEGVELSKIFGANEAHRFVNGVLDQLAQELRMPEVKHGK